MVSAAPINLGSNMYLVQMGPLFLKVNVMVTLLPGLPGEGGGLNTCISLYSQEGQN